MRCAATGRVKSAQNAVTYRDRRAWGEDLCEILVQPVYGDNSTGPAVHTAALARRGDGRSAPGRALRADVRVSSKAMKSSFGIGGASR